MKMPLVQLQCLLGKWLTFPMKLQFVASSRVPSSGLYYCAHILCKGQGSRGQAVYFEKKLKVKSPCALLSLVSSAQPFGLNEIKLPCKIQSCHKQQQFKVKMIIEFLASSSKRRWKEREKKKITQAKRIHILRSFESNYHHYHL